MGGNFQDYDETCKLRTLCQGTIIVT